MRLHNYNIFFIIIMMLCSIFHFYKIKNKKIFIYQSSTTLQFYMDCELKLGAQINKVKNVFYMDLHGWYDI